MKSYILGHFFFILSFELLKMFIALPFASVNVRELLVNVAVKFGILAAFMSVAMSSGIATAMP